MKHLSNEIFILLIYWFIFWRKFIEVPFRMCTSEIASTYFPFWRYLKGRILFKDKLYYPYPACIPFLSSFYPTYILSSFLSQFLSIDNSFRLFSLHILAHSFLSSVLSYFMFLQWFNSTASLMGAISIGYMAYSIKPFTPSAMYTMAWIPGILIGGKIGVLSAFMAITGGYWPILVYILPFVAVMTFKSLLIGSILALPQLIAFLWYWPKSVRHKQVIDKQFGRVPLWRYLDLVLPNRTQTTINGVFWPEMAMYIGIIPFMTLNNIKCLWVCGLLVALTIQIQRIQARSLYLMSFSLVMMAISNRIEWWMVLVQAWLLLQNADIYPHFPFCQWWDKPSKLYQKYEDHVWPNWTGYLKEKFVKSYIGGFSLKC